MPQPLYVMPKKGTIPEKNHPNRQNVTFLHRFSREKSFNAGLKHWTLGTASLRGSFWTPSIKPHTGAVDRFKDGSPS